MKNITKAISTLVALSAINAFGAGYQVAEQGAANMGSAMAGSTANANKDASAAFWNPSSAVFVDFAEGQSTMVSAAISAILPTLSFHDEGSVNPYGSKRSNDCGVDSYVPNLYVVQKFTDDLYGTLSITAPYGLESDYDDDWIGNIQAQRSYLFTIDINPSVVYKVNDWLSVSGGLSVQYAYCTLSQFNPLMGGHMRLSGDSWNVGGNIGITIKYAEDGRLGLHWRSAVRHTLEGSLAGIPSSIEAEMASPDIITLGVYQRLRGMFDRFAVLAEYAYTNWSMFHELAVTGTVNPTVIENWKDTSRVALGFHYYPEFDENLILRFGAAWDESPVRSPVDKTPRIPCCDRVWLSTGLGYTWDNITFDFAYTYIFLTGSGDINRMDNVLVKGTYSGHIHVISAQVSFKF